MVIFTSFLLVLFQGNCVHSTTVVGLTVESALGQNGDYILTVCAVCQHLNGGMEKIFQKK
ncbi:hypothetical protein ALP24_102444 [Pseudomonas syringae pv. aptata]|uniref:Uncharacterized protein n=1 Tax=Pseudomonas syringae pv. aptata TaxID=83167 RepID=A0A3M5WYX1_PSEAP|nr:hypothetical protein ALP24_102444 [Pseudomonas syringae pv. aptata]